MVRDAKRGSAKFMNIAFPYGGKIPADCSATGKNETAGPHETVRVKTDYGRHLIDDRFAYEVRPAVAGSGKVSEVSGVPPYNAEAAGSLEGGVVLDHQTAAPQNADTAGG